MDIANFETFRGTDPRNEVAKQLLRARVAELEQ